MFAGRAGAPEFGQQGLMRIGYPLRAVGGGRGLTLTGLYAQAEAGARWDDGRRSLYGQTVQTTIIGTFAGGNNEIQRDIIARRGFGLPRS